MNSAQAEIGRAALLIGWGTASILTERLRRFREASRPGVLTDLHNTLLRMRVLVVLHKRAPYTGAPKASFRRQRVADRAGADHACPAVIY